MDPSGRQRILVFEDSENESQRLLTQVGEEFERVHPERPGQSQPPADLLLFSGRAAEMAEQLQLCAMGMLNSIPDGLVLLDTLQQVVWHNDQFRQMIGSPTAVYGRTFAGALGVEDIAESLLEQLTSTDDEVAAEGVHEPRRLTVRIDNRKWLGFRAVSCQLGGGGTTELNGFAVTVRDVTREVLEQQKMEAIYKAGFEFGNVTPEEVTSMAGEERVALLKENILTFTQDILGYETFEIRLLNQDTQELIPLLEFGMNPDAAARRLYAKPTGNGVTGFVAHSGSSYMCNDTQLDSLYISGAADARSSLTVPLMLQETVLGTFNVESPGTRSFDQQDLEFLQLFGRVVATALHQLQLLHAEKITTVNRSLDRIRREIAQPTDAILRDATWIQERYIGHDPDVIDRLHQIVAATRKISGQVDQVSQNNEPTAGLGPAGVERALRPALIRKRILVVDSDTVAQDDAHTLLGQMGCNVEGVPNCDDACLMVRSHHYDVVLTDIRLPDVNGYECFRRLRAINSHVPIIMMTGFGYDPTHSIVNARKEGLKAVLYKPFRRGQLLDELEKAVTTPPPSDADKP